MSKIIETIVEPSKIYTGSIFKLKIKAIRYINYGELKTDFDYSSLYEYTYNYLKGDQNGNN